MGIGILLFVIIIFGFCSLGSKYIESLVIGEIFFLLKVKNILKKLNKIVKRIYIL